MSIALLNTVALPNVLLAHGKNHVAVYQNGVVSTYAKDDANNTLTLQPTTYALADVLALKMSNDGSVVAAQTATKTYRLTGGAQTPIDIVGAFDVANDGTLVIINVGAQQISVVQAVTRNFTAAVTANDKVAVGTSKFIVYNKSRYFSGSFLGSTIPVAQFDYTVTFVIAATGDKFAFFFDKGDVQYNGLTRTGMQKLYYHRNIGKYVVANDGTSDWAYQRHYPQSTPFKLRANAMVLPVVTDMSPFTWMQMRFDTNSQLEEVAEMQPVLGTNVSVAGGKLVNTLATNQVLDGLTPVYFKANEDFSIEGWANFTSIGTAAATIIGLDVQTVVDGNRSFILYVAQDLTVGFMLSANGSYVNYTYQPTSPKITLNSDNHFAACRVSGTLKLYLNGVEIYSGANNTVAYKSTMFMGIRLGATGSRWGLRVCRGESAYKGAFEPVALTALTPQYYEPAIRDDIVFQSAFRNNDLINEMDFVGGRQITMTGTTSVSNGRLKTAQSAAARWSAPLKYFGAGDFTIEVLFRLMQAPGNANNALLCQYQNVGAGNGFLIFFNSAGNWLFYYPAISTGGQGPGPSVSSSVAIPVGVDVHLVVERVGTTIKLYMDGVEVGSATNTEGLLDVSNTLPLRTWWGDSSMITNVSYKWIRIAKRAMYNGVIKPFAAPPKRKAVPTYLIKDGIVAPGITPTGGSASSGSWRMPFNAYLTMPNAPQLAPGSQDFACEIDFSVQSATTVSGSAFTPFVYWGTFAAPGQAVNYEIVYNHTAQQFSFSANHSGAAGTTVSFPFALAFNTQYLVKFLRTNGVLACYVNGVKIGEAAYTEVLLNDTVQPFYVGRRIGGSSGNVFWYGDWTCKNFSIGAIDQT